MHICFSGKQQEFIVGKINLKFSEKKEKFLKIDWIFLNKA